MGIHSKKPFIEMLAILLLLCGCWMDGTRAQKNPSKKRVTVTIVNRRLVEVEKKLTDVVQELVDTKTQLQQLKDKVQALEAGGGGSSHGGGGAAAAPIRQKFTDLPPCPDIDGFWFAADMRSCYHLEPANVLSNYTEATAVCAELNPKAHIVAIDNADEQTFLREMWFNERGIASISRFWINLKKVAGRNQWKWDHNGRRLLYSRWIPTTSHDDDRFQCAAVYSNEGYFWGDVACWGPHMVTCEVDM